MGPDYVWIMHNNCKRSCSHCFCNPLPEDDAENTKGLVQDLNRHGLDVRIYASDQMDCQLDALCSDLTNVPLIPGRALKKNPIQHRPKIDRIAFSLHGPSADIHERIAPPGDFNATLSELNRIRKEQKIDKLQILSVIHGENWRLLEKMCAFFHVLGASEVSFLKLCYAGRSRKLPKEMFLTQEQVYLFLKSYYRIKGRHNNMDITLANNWGPHYSKLRQLFIRFYSKFKSKLYCDCGKNHFTIQAATKEVYPCRYTITTPELKLGHFDPEKGLVLTRDWMKELPHKIQEPCGSCKILNFCNGGCRALAVTEKHRMEGFVDSNAGFANCPVHMGATPWIDLQKDIPTVLNLLKRAFLKLKPSRKKSLSARADLKTPV